MITRALLRTKATQILYSCHQTGNFSIKHVDNELNFSIKKTYDLYHYLLLLPVEITRYAAMRIDAAMHKLRPTYEDLNPNRRLVDSSFIEQLSSNSQLLAYQKAEKVSWADNQDIIKTLFEQLEKTDYYQSYMQTSITSYEADQEFWRKFFKQELLNNELFEELLEDMSIYWLDDLETVISFAQKTIKKFEPSNGFEQPLLPMFKDDTDKDFIFKLVHDTLLHNDKYSALIENYTSNWDIDRIAYMDTLIMKMAVSELNNFATIPVNVTLNEYIEIAKYYSTPRSATFINGILDKIVSEMRRNNELQKVGEIGVENNKLSETAPNTEI